MIDKTTVATPLEIARKILPGGCTVIVDHARGIGIVIESMPKDSCWIVCSTFGRRKSPRW